MVPADGRVQRTAASIAGHATRFAAQVETHPWFALVWFTVFYALAAVGAALRRDFWLDELVALYVSTLPRVQDIWSALLRTVDGNPPLYYLLSRLLLRGLGETELVARLPAILGFWVAGLCLFAFVRRHTSTVAASIALVCFAQSGALPWAYEARPYAVVLGFAGLALLSWQRCAGSSRSLLWPGVLALSVAGLVSTHFYAALLIVPLASAEATRWLGRRRIEWAPGLAMCAGMVPLIFWMPIVRNVRGNVAGNALHADYFAQPTMGALFQDYSWLLFPLIPALLISLILVLFLTWRRSDPDGQEDAYRRSIPFAELALAAGLATFPILVFLVAVLVTQTYVLRYVLPGAMGLAMLAGFLVHFALRKRPAIALAVLGVLSAQFYISALSLGFAGNARAYDDHPLLLEQNRGRLPIVISEGLIFPPLWRYAPPFLKRRLFYVTDLPFARKTTDTTNEIILLKIRPMAPDAIVGLDGFLTANRSFLLYYVGNSANSSLDALLARHYTVSLQAKRGHELLFLVTAP